MLDKDNPVDLEAIESLRSFHKRASGLSFCLAMRLDDGSVKIWDRIDQPCYGEFRKYKKTHGDECTQPVDSRPGDLHWPFPEGIPEGFAFSGDVGGARFPSAEKMNEFLFSDDSPWKRGFGSASSVELIKGKDNEGYVNVVFLDTEIDPTVLISLMNIRKIVDVKAFNHWIELGLTEKEAFVTCMIQRDDPSYTIATGGDGYYCPIMVDYPRYFSGDPHDLTGGTFRNRFDYNRKRLHDVFSTTDKEMHLYNWIVKNCKLEEKVLYGTKIKFITRESLAPKLKEFYSKFQVVL